MIKRFFLANLTFLALLMFSTVECRAGAYPNQSILVETDWLATQLQEAQVRIIDMQESRDAYLQGHIPGAVYMELDEVVSAIKGVSRKIHLWPGAKESEKIEEYCASWGADTGELDIALIEKKIREAGIGNDTLVVIYDDTEGLYAAQFFLALELAGHDKMALLNGGIAKWTGENRPLAREVPWVEPGAFKARVNTGLLADAVWILKELENPQVALLDVRSKPEYTGGARLSKRGGHMPGAIHLEWKNAIDSLTKTFKTEEELEKLLEGQKVTKDKTVITYCQAGIRASHTYFVLRLLGYDKARLYYPSWNEWGNSETLPVAK